jgi:heavy metal sensor kinase
VDRILYDESLELVRNTKDNNTDFLIACRQFAEEISHRKNYPLFFRVLTIDGKIYFESFESKSVLPSSFNQIQDSFATLRPSEQLISYRIYQTSFMLTDDKSYIIQIITPIRLPKKILENYRENIIAIIPIVLILSLGCGLLVSRKPHEILRSIVATTQNISSQNLEERLPVPKTSDETKDLITSINSMMDRLEKSFDEIKQFTSDVSHELRTPLFSLKGEIEVALSKSRSNEEYKKALEESFERVNLLIKMINDLFLISRFELKRVDLDLLQLNLNGILKDLYDFFLPIAQEKKLNFTIEKSENIFVNADKTRIYQLFSNLIENAIKFTPENGSVRLSLISKNKSAQFTIKDNGVGIPEADIPYIFNRFYQADKARSGPSRGTGLGLNICKKIVESHGGSISVILNEDKGVTFTVILPKAS